MEDIQIVMPAAAKTPGCHGFHTGNLNTSHGNALARRIQYTCSAAETAALDELAMQTRDGRFEWQTASLRMIFLVLFREACVK